MNGKWWWECGKVSAFCHEHCTTCLIAQTFVFAYSVLQNLNDSVMPAVSEAFSNAKRKLSQYYVSMNYKWAAMVAG